MAKRKFTPAASVADRENSEYECRSVRALLARTRPLSGNEVPDVYWEGRGLLEQWALDKESVANSNARDTISLLFILV